MLSFLLLLSLTNAIKSLIDYNNLFDTSIFEADNAYKVYAMLFLLQLIFLCTIIILTMEEVLIDDNMVFDIDNLKGFLNDTSSFGFIAK
ncbi:hypothetical protein, partial [Staphylococcus pseudintermedius]